MEQQADPDEEALRRKLLRAGLLQLQGLGPAHIQAGLQSEAHLDGDLCRVALVQEVKAVCCHLHQKSRRGRREFP